MNEAVKHEIFAQYIYKFMNISFKTNSATAKSTNLIEKVIEFVGKINSTTNNRMKLIENFE